MAERYEGRADHSSASARRGFAITAHDAIDLAAETRAVYVGSGGALAVLLSSGDEVILTGVAGGTILPLRITRVLATGTTASDLVGLY